MSEESGSISFKAKAKFSHLTAGAWDSKGVGTFMLRVRNDGSNKPFMTFTTEAVSRSEDRASDDKDCLLTG